MKEVNVGDSLVAEMSLWRYMSIDKFINLLSEKKLFLTPVSFYHESNDPFEGFLPQVAFEAKQEVNSKKVDELKARNEKLRVQYNESVSNGFVQASGSKEEPLDALDEKVEGLQELFISSSIKISKSTCVNCWYHSESESEAMWKLYSDSGKGIAIKTSVDSLVRALNICKPNISLCVGRVKYLDFLSDDLKARDCLSDGHTSPLLKRKEFEHENEIRLFSVPNLDADSWENHEPTPIQVDVDLSALIESVYISPYSKEPFNSSVRKLCDLFEISVEKVVDSQLLGDYEKKLRGFVTPK